MGILVTVIDGEQGMVLVSIPPTTGERARGELGRRIEVARDEAELLDPEEARQVAERPGTRYDGAMTRKIEIMIVGCLTQKQLVRGLTSGAVKSSGVSVG